VDFEEDSVRDGESVPVLLGVTDSLKVLEVCNDELALLVAVASWVGDNVPLLVVDGEPVEVRLNATELVRLGSTETL
jgi:hypothetical protein